MYRLIKLRCFRMCCENSDHGKRIGTEIPYIDTLSNKVFMMKKLRKDIETKIKRHAKLEKEYIGTNHIKAERNIYETRGGGTRADKMRKEPAQHDIAVHGARVV